MQTNPWFIRLHSSYRGSRNQRGLFSESFLSLDSLLLLRFSAVKMSLDWMIGTPTHYLLRRSGPSLLDLPLLPVSYN
jgi:hypothetical protein